MKLEKITFIIGISALLIACSNSPAPVQMLRSERSERSRRGPTPLRPCRCRYPADTSSITPGMAGKT